MKMHLRMAPTEYLPINFKISHYFSTPLIKYVFTRKVNEGYIDVLDSWNHRHPTSLDQNHQHHILYWHFVKLLSQIHRKTSPTIPLNLKHYNLSNVRFRGTKCENVLYLFFFFFLTCKWEILESFDLQMREHCKFISRWLAFVLM